jgi:hypothetical protein
MPLDRLAAEVAALRSVDPEAVVSADGSPSGEGGVRGIGAPNATA